MAEHYRLKAGVILSFDIKRKVKTIADKYYALTNKDIVVTSGTRTSQSQAEAMYAKLAGGDKLTVYKNQSAAKEIKKAYDDGQVSKKSKAQIIKDIKTVIDKQISRNVYISKHLKKGAVDIRSRDMSASEKTNFKKSAKGIASIIILETVPPHFHLQL